MNIKKSNSNNISNPILIALLIEIGLLIISIIVYFVGNKKTNVEM